MKPLRLELAGFGCFKESAVVSFEELELFAIAGPTGAGKSTLLDALTYALYGQTARLGARGLDALLSPGAVRLSVELSFETARGTHRVVRTADRSPSGNVTRQTRVFRMDEGAEWRQLPESEKLRDADAKLQELVGLDYDGFTRAVMLPQGAFDEFLRGDATKRRRLLVALLGLDRVESVQKEAGRRSREAELRASAIRTRLEEDYADATPDRLRALKDELAAVGGRLEQLEARREAAQAERREAEEVAELAKELGRLEERWASLSERAGEMDRLRERLESARRASMLAPGLRQLEGSEGRLRTLRRECEEARKSLLETSDKAGRARERRERARRELEARVPELEARVAALSEASTRMETLRRRGGDLGLAVRAAGAESYSEEAWEELAARTSELPALERLEREVAAALDRSAEAGRAMEELTAQLRETSERLQTLERAGKEARQAADEAARAYREAEREHRAAALRADLRAGEACPVCGSTVHQLPHREAVVLDGLARQRDEAEAELTRLRNAFSDERARQATLEERLQGRRVAQAEALALGERLKDERKRLLLRLGVPEGIEHAGVARQLEERRGALLAALATEVVERTGGSDPALLRQGLQRERQALEREAKTAEAEAAAAEQAEATAATRGEMLERQLREAEEDAASQRSGLEESLERAGFADLDGLRRALADEGQIAAMEARLAAYASEREATQRQRLEVEAKLRGRRPDPQRRQELEREWTELSSALSDAQSAKGRLERDLQDIEGRIERARALRRELVEVQERFDLYRQLHLDLRGNQFPDYLMTQAQHRLARRASGIIRDVSDGRYDLRLVDGDYYVSDAWHPGELRSARTLSGGETFIASLALALALSDTIAGSQALGALFLDEGFGTLDAVTLDAVAGVLESLVREGRMVGIVTHVAELTERMPARLLVAKGPNGSSVSWDG